MNNKFRQPKRPRKKSWRGGNVEDREQGQLMAWVKSRYTEVLCETDIAGLNISKHNASKLYAQRQPRKGWPDIRIYERKGDYTMLMIEYKRTGADILKKDGTLLSDSHLKQQAKTHAGLINRGYLAGFCVGLENAKKAIIAYMESDFETLKEYLIHV